MDLQSCQPLLIEGDRLGVTWTGGRSDGRFFCRNMLDRWWREETLRYRRGLGGRELGNADLSSTLLGHEASWHLALFSRAQREANLTNRSHTVKKGARSCGAR